MPVRYRYNFLLIFFFYLISCKEKEVQQFTIAFSQCTGDDAWRRDMLRGMQENFLFTPMLNLTTWMRTGVAKNKYLRYKR